MVLEGGKVLGGVSTQYPQPPGMECVKGVRGVSGATAVSFGKNFIKQKLQGTLDSVGGGYPFRAPNLDLEGPGPHVLLETLSFTMKVC